MTGRSPEAMRYRAWYFTAAWRKLRAHQLAREPRCRMCVALKRPTPATIADHVTPHRGDPRLFFDPGNLQSLCATHHSSVKARLEQSGRAPSPIAADGWPTTLRPGQ